MPTKEYYKKHKATVLAANERWRKLHPEKTFAAQAKRRKNRKELVIKHYGCKCSCPNCPETNPAFLTVDHIDSNGSNHRIYGKRAGGDALYNLIIKSNFPPEYRLLCWNCNCGRQYNGGQCPHLWAPAI